MRQVHEKYISAKCGSLKELNESQDISLGISKCIKSYIKFLQIKRYHYFLSIYKTILLDNYKHIKCMCTVATNSAKVCKYVLSNRDPRIGYGHRSM